MSAIFPGFVILLGVLHVCSGKTLTLGALVDIKTQRKINSAISLFGIRRQNATLYQAFLKAGRQHRRFCGVNGLCNFSGEDRNSLILQHHLCCISAPTCLSVTLFLHH